MKMLSKPEGISKMMKAVQGLASGMGMGGGGPLFGGGNQAMNANTNTNANFDINANALPSQEELKKQFDDIQAKLPKQFKQRF